MRNTFEQMMIQYASWPQLDPIWAPKECQKEPKPTPERIQNDPKNWVQNRGENIIKKRTAQRSTSSSGNHIFGPQVPTGG